MSSAEADGGRGRFDPAGVGWIAAGLGLAAAIGLSALRFAAASGPGPEAMPGPVIGTFALWGGPAIVGAIGTATRRRDVLAGAGLAYLPLALLSFSGVALALLAPALLFLYAGLRSPARQAAPMRRTDRPAIMLATTGLLITGLIGLFATMQAVCWEELADGTIRQHTVAAEDLNGIEMTVGVDGVVASGCSSGEISAAGTAITVGCLSIAAGLAIRVGRARG
jgi:hypothetical protein